MKKIMILVLSCLWLVSCVNPFDKYGDSVDQLQQALAAVGTIETEIADIEAQIARLDDVGTQDFTEADITEIYTSLQTINNNLDNEIVQAVLENFLEQNNISLDGNIEDLETQLNALPEFSGYSGTNPSQTDVTNLLTSILTNLTTP